MECTGAENDERLWEALEHLQSAIALLDLTSAPGHIAAHVDLAVHQLREVVEGSIGGQVAVKSS